MKTTMMTVKIDDIDYILDINRGIDNRSLIKLPAYPLHHGDIYVDPHHNCNSFLLIEALYHHDDNFEPQDCRWQLLGLGGTSVNSGWFSYKLHTDAEIREYLATSKMKYSKNVSQEIYDLVSGAN